MENKTRKLPFSKAKALQETSLTTRKRPSVRGSAAYVLLRTISSDGTTQNREIRKLKQPAVDLDIIEESALAMAQSTIENAITKSGISRAEMARRMKRNRSFVSRMLTGSHNLTVKTMAKSLAVCGFEVRFQPVALEWNWDK